MTLLSLGTWCLACLPAVPSLKVNPSSCCVLYTHPPSTHIPAQQEHRPFLCLLISAFRHPPLLTFLSKKSLASKSCPLVRAGTQCQFPCNSLNSCGFHLLNKHFLCTYCAPDSTTGTFPLSTSLTVLTKLFSGICYIMFTYLHFL